MPAPLRGLSCSILRQIRKIDERQLPREIRLCRIADRAEQQGNYSRALRLNILACRVALVESDVVT